MKRDHRPSRRAEFGRYLCSIDWSSINSDQNSCEEMWNFFYDVIFAGLDLLMPIKEIKISTTDAPWMNDRLKLLKLLLLTDLNRLYLNNIGIWSIGSKNRVEQSTTN